MDKEDKVKIILDGKKYYYSKKEVEQYNKFIKERESKMSNRIPFYGHEGGFKD